MRDAMCNQRFLLITALLSFGFLLGCQQAEQTSLSEEEKAAVRSTSESWMAAAADGRWEDAAATYTEDAILWFNGQKIEGRASILTFLQQMSPMVGMELIIDEIYGQGNVAVVSGHTTQEIDGDTILSGYYLDTRLRQPDGTWFYHRDMVAFFLAPPFAGGASEVETERQ